MTMQLSHKAIERLEAAGIGRSEAKAIVEVMQSNDESLATKEDIRILKEDNRVLKEDNRVLKEAIGVLDAKIDMKHDGVVSEIRSLRADLTTRTATFVGIGIGFVALLIVVLRYLPPPA